jgi:hypothetical protein
MTDVETRGAFAPVADAMRDIRAAEAALREEQDAAWKRYLERVDAALAFNLQVDQHLDDDDHNPNHMLDALRGTVGQLRLQTRLGAMEGEELVGRLRAALRRLAPLT